MTTTAQATTFPRIGVTLPPADPANTDKPNQAAEQQPTDLGAFWREMARSSRYDGLGLIDAAFSAGERAVRQLATEASAPTSDAPVKEPA